jgi:hypothetical protein
VDFDKAAVFLNSNLQFELNRVTQVRSLWVRYSLTPLTSVSISATQSQDRFEFSSLRDSKSSGASASITFDPLGVVSGVATLGFTDFEPSTPGLQHFQGLTAAVNVSYRFVNATRVSVSATRKVDYSLDINQPYYVLSGFSASIVRRVAGPFDVMVNGGWQVLAYRDRVGADVAISDRVDSIRDVGGGVGYHFGRTGRLGIYIDNARRISDVSRRQYDDFRFGSTLTYGF